MNPIRRPRASDNSSSGMCETSVPPRKYRPAVGRSRHPIKFSMVDLPEPEGPMIATYEPGWITGSTPRKARTSTSAPSTYRFSMPARRMSGSTVRIRPGPAAFRDRVGALTTPTVPAKPFTDGRAFGFVQLAVPIAVELFEKFIRIETRPPIAFAPTGAVGRPARPALAFAAAKHAWSSRAKIPAPILPPGP